MYPLDSKLSGRFSKVDKMHTQLRHYPPLLLFYNTRSVLYTSFTSKENSIIFQMKFNSVLNQRFLMDNLVLL